MSDLADKTTQQLLRKIIREETASLDDKVRTIVREETAGIRDDLRKVVQEETAGVHATFRTELRTELRADFRKDMRTIVQEETADIRDDVKLIKEVQGQQGIMLRTIQSGLGGLKNSFRAQTREMHKLGVLFEDLDHRFQAAVELD